MSEPQVYTFKELEKFQMYTPAPGAQGKRSALRYSSYRGNPRLSLFTNVPNDSNRGMLNAAMNPETFLIFLDLLEKIARDPGPGKYKIDCMTTPRAPEGAERSTEKILGAELYFGRDENGIVWISVTAPNRPRIKFEYRLSEFHKVYKGDGTALTESEGSTLQALATVLALREVFLTHMGELRPPYVPNGTKAESGKPAAKFDSAGFDDLTF